MMSTPRIASGFTVDPASYAHDLDAIRAVREPVFLIEQQVPPDLEWDALDPLSQHVLARDPAGHPIGTGRLTPEHRIGRMAVLPDWRGKGVGEAMLMRLLDRARELGYPSIELHAQTHAIPFYARAGFRAEGERFVEAGIDHQIMRMRLEPRESPPRTQLAQDAEIAIDSLEACRSTALALLQQAKRKLWIYTRDLDPDLLCNEAALAEIRRLALSGRGAELRLLVQDPEAALRPAAKLISLAQRATTTVAIRAPVDEVDLNYPSAFLLNDVGGYLFRPLGGRFEGSTHSSAAGRNRQLQDLFNQVWERSETPGTFRALKL